MKSNEKKKPSDPRKRHHYPAVHEVDETGFGKAEKKRMGAAKKSRAPGKKSTKLPKIKLSK